jgi:succinate dehydrogenase/fumarate reductase cytochrome b subunit
MYLHEDREIYKNTIEDVANSCGRVLGIIMLICLHMLAYAYVYGLSERKFFYIARDANAVYKVGIRSIVSLDKIG